MTGESTQQGKGSVTDLIGTMRHIAGLMNSSLGWSPDGTMTELGHACAVQLSATVADLADVEPASLEDVAALVSYGKAHCALGAQAARDFDPVRAAADLEIAVALLAKASKRLESMTGVAPVDVGLGPPLN